MLTSNLVSLQWGKYLTNERKPEFMSNDAEYL